MDTLTHFAVGACMGELAAGKKVGKKALAIGGAAQLIPDIDFLCGLWMTPAANALAHRGFTHSILFTLAIAPLVAWSLWRRRYGVDPNYVNWLLFVGAEMFAHLLLDAFNAYGTGWLEPFSHRRISFNAVFVADPFFSIPVGLACFILLVAGMKFRWRREFAFAGLLCGVFYLLYGLYNKWEIEKAVQAEITRQSLPTQAHFTTPTPFNNWLWYVVVTDSSGSYVSYRSVFDTSPHMHFEFFARNDSLLEVAPEDERLNHEIQLLKRFSQGYYTVDQRGDTVMFNDLRFGQMLGWENRRAGFVFHYYLQPPLDNTVVLQRGRFAGWDPTVLRKFLRRVAGE